MSDEDRDAPLFAIGARVRVLAREGSNTPRTGTIVDAIWHHKLGRWHYWIESEGKRVSKRYAAEDLAAAG